MRVITVSTDVFAAIWGQREPGENSEEDVLRRLLGLVDKKLRPTSLSRTGGSGLGIVDDRYGVQFPDGFEIFRVYKGREYHAKVTQGQWLLNDGKMYPSLHKLSAAVIAGNENSWNNWKFRRSDGRDALIDTLRDQSKVMTRA